MANPTMTSAQKALGASLVQEEDLAELESVLKTLRDGYDEAEKNGRLFLMSQYIMLIGVIQPEVARIQRRFHRESIASLRRQHKLLKLEAREAAEGANA